MYQQNVTVHYIDGSSKEVVLTQWSMGQFAQWSARQGLSINTGDPGLMGLVMMRYQAYCELHRDGGATPSFDKWDRTVAEVDPVGEPDAVDPTQTAASGGSSQ